MTTYADVRTAKTPQDALLAIAEALDRIEDKLTTPDKPADPWAQWDGGEALDAPIEEETPVPKAALAEYAKVKEALEKCSDPEDAQALQAKLNLLKDELKPKPHYADAEQRASQLITDANGNVIVDLPTADEETQERRREFAEKCLKLEQEYGPEVLESYVKGGPLVIYYTDRDFVMRMPDDYKRVMVSDVEQFSPREAQQMGRDVLKDVDPEGGREVTMEALSRDR